MGSKSPHPEGATPSPQPSPKGRGSNSAYSEIGTIQSHLSQPEDLGEGAIKSPLPLGEGKGEGAPAHMIELAKNLRKNQTDAEKLMWQLLRNRQVANAKFRRQQPIEGYIADFYCHERKLVIELDGSQHFTEDGIKQDALRTQRLNQLGITVVRFDNRQVLLETEAVLEVIYNALKAPHPNPLPEGEGTKSKSPSPPPSPKGRGSKSTHSEIGTIQSPLPLGEGKGEGRSSSPLPLGEDLGEGALIRQNLEVLGYGE